uniref:Uncharacterized protein n=1 Tax=Panagrolaimus sp. PS1159 TaxID=55785 RepID=A0AC35FXJ7_9BILA
MVTITFKLFILVLFSFGFLEVSCRQRNGNNDDRVRPVYLFETINDLVRVARDGDNDPLNLNNNGPEVIASTFTAPTTKATKSAASVKPLTDGNVTDSPTLGNTTTKYVKRTLKNKDTVPLLGFGLLTLFGYLFSANLITLMLLYTNKMCVSKKKLHILQSPTPVA